MSLLDKVSLCITPNAYKEDVLYSVVPSDGSGDMNVVRATTATRVNADGLIEVVPKNLLSYSEQFDNASWIKQTSTIIENSTISPNGTLTADLLYPNSSGNYRALRQSNNTLIGEINLSVYLKAQNKSKAYIRLDDAKYALFDLINGTIVEYNSIEIPTIENVGNGWYRCSLNYNALSLTTNSFYLGIIDTSYPSVTANGTDGIYLWGAQTTNVFGATSYFPTTDRLNIPRLDYSGGGCPSILVEPQRTNLALYSEQFDNAYWTKLNTTVTANTTTAPDGTLTADSIISSGGVNSFLYKILSFTSGTVYNLSFYVKANSAQTIRIYGGGGGIGTSANLNVTTEWTRISYTFIPSSTGSFDVGIRSNSSNVNFDIFIWGAQLEAGSTATEYFPTTTRLNIPRIDYTNGSCPSILVEGQRTNRALYSNTFDNAYWIKTNVTLSSTSGGIINGGNYYTVTCDGTTGTFKGIGKGFLNDSANTYSLSVFAKAGTSSTFIVSSRNFLTSNSVFASFNLSNGTINSQDGGTASIVNYGNGWYRCTFVVVNAGTYTNQASIFFGHPINAADGLTLLVSGAQAEAGSYATSYIPTVASAVTRNADFLTRAGFGNTSTSGTLLFDLYAENISSSAGEYILQLFVGAIITDTFFSTANSISIIANGTSIQIFNNGFTQLVQSITPTQGQRVKIAIRYNGTNISSSINGTVSSVLTDTSVGVKNAIRINNGQFSTHAFNSVVFIPEYLTDEQCILLTGDSYVSYAEMANALNYTIQ